MLYMIGLGFMPEDISVRALRAVRSCTRVYLDTYTSVIISYEDMRHLMENVLQRTDLIQCDRKAVEQEEDKIIADALQYNVAFLVAGDVFCATTHTNLYLKAVQQKVSVVVMHNASIMTAVSCTGLEMYRFGRTVSIPIFTSTWRPSSFMDYYLENARLNLHTLVLLQMSTRELDMDLYCNKGLERYSDPYYLLPNQAARQILSLVDEHPDAYKQVSDKTLVVVCCRVGTDTQFIELTTLGRCASQADEYYGKPMYALVVPSPSIAEQESRMLELFTEDASVKNTLKEVTR
ncbi:Diphthine synthase [Giardia duodenalis]|uniref:diphthine methyl ester synthase n=1 Tax=Giardia intestinalis (strain ATCC 50803 / WB clone C6) TaxID=184922 RepID=A8BBU1_GIAIC|nr:Diphthine synthase [Giardia intestinalis]KAE8305237.1 Diphthine synthase [Giardia intestinalis]|eukprot:XP_001708065.1 Diphthine synthase [Giardia lamblia ATCC 50803]